MTYILLTLGRYLGVILFDLRKFIKKGNGKLLLIYIPILIITLVINIIHGLNVNIPNINDKIKSFIEIFVKID
jgi:NhaP-type Na+/H+ or K+/H+ antiporter